MESSPPEQGSAVPVQILGSYVLGDQNIRVKCDKCRHELLSVSDPLEINDDGNGDDIDCSHGNGVDNENDDWDNTIFILPRLLCSNPK